jgi:glucan 1,4-alpha-glucosidase
MRNFVQPAKVKMFLPFYFCLFTCLSFAQTLAPGAPGNDAQWATAGKQAIGTSASLESKVWFTLADGALTEVYYPDVTVANVHKLEFVVVNPKMKKVETETADAIHEIKVMRPDSLSFQQINTAKSGEWKITKTYTTDVERDTILISVRFEPRDKGLKLYVYYDPSIANTGMHDSGSLAEAATRITASGDYSDTVFIAQEKNIVSALGSMEESKEKKLFPIYSAFKGVGFAKSKDMTNGFLGVSDGLTQLQRESGLTDYATAENGNVVQVAEMKYQSEKNEIQPFVIALSFGKTVEEAEKNYFKSLEKGFAKCQAEYEKGWSDYVKTLPKVEAKYQAQFNMAAMVLKAQEDKTVRGANVASLTIPWGGGKNANEDVGGGYHLVWARDLYQVFTAYLALGDTAAANRALDFLFNIQQKPDGSFPQNSWLDGRNGWGGLQMDEVGFPLIMAYQLKRFDKATWENHVKKAADFLVKNGPRTPQERWEEKPGYSPSTIAAEIAGLVCAAEIARKNNDEISANLYLKTADDWQANIEKWTATTNGKFGDGNYYVRLTANGKPDAGEKIELSNSSGAFFENEIVDAGFLELVRLGIKSPDDPLIVKSLKVIDAQIKVNTPNGESFYRYNHDGYGEQPDGRRWNFDGTYSGTGRLWALLAGERGQYELALTSRIKEKHDTELKTKEYITEQDDRPVFRSREVSKTANERLDAMAKFANEGLMIPEQIWDKAETPKNIDKQFVPELKFGEGTGSATPLAWSMAQFIRLAVNLQAGKNLDTPDVVYNRYILGKKDDSKLANSISDQKGFYQNLPVGKSFSEIVKPKSPQIIECESKLGLKTCDNTKQMQACILYSGNFKNLEIAGDFTEWKPQKLNVKNNGKEIETECLTFAKSARVEYKLIVDGKWITDPLNPNKVDNGVGGENSFFTMPDYKPTIWDKEGNTLFSSPHTEITVDSKIYGKRTIKVYNPITNSEESFPLPTLYLQDGTDYLNRTKAIAIQENLVKAGKIKPFIMVFVDYKDRNKEYYASDDYAKFLATEVVPAIDAKYNTIKSRDGRAVLGASLGGITSVWVGLKYPEIFSRIGGQSSSFWVDNERVVKELEKLDANSTKYKFYFDDGTLEGVEDSRKVVELLRKKSFDVTYVEGEAGHNWTSWRDRLADAFISLMN